MYLLKSNNVYTIHFSIQIVAQNVNWAPPELCKILQTRAFLFALNRLSEPW